MTPNLFESLNTFQTTRVDLSVTKFKVQGAMLGPKPKIKIFTNLDFPEIRGFPFLSYLLEAQVVSGRYNLTRVISHF